MFVNVSRSTYSLAPCVSYCRTSDMIEILSPVPIVDLARPVNLQIGSNIMNFIIILVGDGIHTMLC